MPAWFNGCYAGGAVGQGVTIFRHVNDFSSGNATETNTQWQARGSYTAKNLWIYIVSNNGTQTIRDRKNAANGGGAISAAATGAFEDTSGTTALVNSDLYCFQLTAGGSHTNTFTPGCIGIMLDDGTSNIPPAIVGNYSGVNVGSSNVYTYVLGPFTPTSLEGQAQNLVRYATTFTNLTTYVAANTIASSYSPRTRKNSADSGMAVSIPASSTGRKEDSSGSFAVAAGDLIGYGFSSAGGGFATLHSLAMKASTAFNLIGGASNLGVGTQLNYFSLALQPVFTLTEALIQTKTRVADTWKNASAYVGALVGPPMTLKFRVNSANPSGGPVVSASGTGFSEDLTGSYVSAATDLINWSVVAGGPSGNNLYYVGIQQGTVVMPTLVAAQGSYSLTGRDSTFSRTRIMPSVQGSYLLTGQAIILNKGRMMFAAQGGYVLTGQAAILLWKHFMTAVQGSYVLSGQATNLLWKHFITAVRGLYTYTGFTANLLFGRKVTAVQGSYTLTGQPANLIWKRIMVALQGAYSYTGFAVNFFKGRTLTALQGAYVYTGIASILRRNVPISLVQGAYVLTGQIANLLRGKRVIGVTGNYVYTGQVALFPRTWKLTTVLGSYALNGQSVNLLFGHRLSPNVGFYVLTGPDVTLLKGTQRVLTASFGAYALSGQPVNLLWKHVMPAAFGTYTYTGQPNIFRRGRTVSAGQGAYAYSGQPSILLWKHTLTSVQGSYVLTGRSANLLRGYPMTVVRGLYVYTGQPSNLLWKRILTALQGSYLVTGVAALLRRTRIMPGVQGSYILTGQSANLIRSAFPTLIASQGGYLLTGQPAVFRFTHKMPTTFGSYGYTGQAANLLKGKSFLAAQGAYVLTGEPSVLRRSRLLPANNGLYGLIGFPAGLIKPLSPLHGVVGLYNLTGFDAQFAINEITFFYYIDLTLDENEPTESELVGTGARSGGFKYVFP